MSAASRGSRLQRTAARTGRALERRFGFRSRRGVLAATLGVAALCALLSLLRGQDANWDLRNYHLHNAWSLLQGRIGLDLAPAQLQSYFVPLLDVPYYLLVQHFPAPVAGAALGLLHGLAFLPLAWIAWRVLGGDPRRDRRAPLLALAGLASAAFLSELGNTMGDNSTAPLVLGALALALPGGDGRWRGMRLFAAGGLLGLAVGLKLTNAGYAVALGLAVLAAPLPARERLRAATQLTLATAAVFALVAGPWLYRVWSEFGNPLFPQYNAWFQAPLAASDVTGDIRWRPRGWGQALLWPLLFTADPYLAGEVALPQVAWAVLYLAALAAAAAWLRRRLSGVATTAPVASAVPAAVPRMVGVFFLAGFVLWLGMFGIHRYLVVLELLAPVVLWMLLRGLLPSRSGERLAWLAVAGCALVAVAGWNGWGHARWTRQAFAVERPALPAPGTVLLVGDEPHSWRVPFLWPESSYVGVASNFPESPAYVQRVRTMVAARGPALALLKATADEAGFRERRRNAKIERENRWASRLRLDRGDCGAMRWLASRGKRRELLQADRSPSGRCRFVAAATATAGHGGDAPAAGRDREQLVAAAALARRYGLRMAVEDCSSHASRVGDAAFPYLLCPVEWTARAPGAR
ncbi:hypothetical protein B1992_02260 [Pseudoxanthomonas broegbernensis]|uniref:DUF2029 domain-containing protein n=1 Tax=Pseudoxanthomonas broegbernensis TaxID=83619 RepID=A0A7V8K7Q8_9GAMM|nr:glycosyltransferase 87 family protein [Pseudoxanthomonas broegbernensis]KAF1687512.1 hypothetical protein B1992_02260 [Pseudoxanthomonas broegbernensis]MBB6064517.1 hypothetical protein [Pseudoxanthomonas broegbernensis]